MLIREAAIDTILADDDRRGWYKAVVQPPPPRRRAARPIADPPPGALLDRAEELAKAWLLALIEQEPLAGAASILAAELAAEGPAICAAVARALGSDAELGRIAAGGELERLGCRTARIAGARTAEQASCAVEALRAVIWSAALTALPDPDPDQVARLADRLSLVSEVVRGAALRGVERASEAAGTHGPRASSPEPAIRVRRTHDWPGALEREVMRSQAEHAPLSLLLVELEDAERMLAVETAPEAAAIFERFAQALGAQARPTDVVIHEAASRVWVIAPGSGREAAVDLGSKFAGAVAATEPWRGAPLCASVGIAVLGEDGDDCPGLIESAEEARFAAAASGIEITRSRSCREPG